MAKRAKPVFLPTFQSMVDEHLERKWRKDDGISAEMFAEEFAASPAAAEIDQIPLALKEFYLAVGNCDDLMETDLFFFDPDELEIRDGFLMFVEDGEETAVWGIEVDQASLPDPLVWMRDSGADEDEGEWENQEGTITEWITDAIAWSLEDDE